MPAGPRTDFDLLEAWRGGDRGAGNALVNRYFHEVAKFFGNRVGDDARQDLTQETFKKLTTAKENFRGSSSFRTFLFGIARHVLNDFYRSKRKSFDPITHSLEDLGGGTPSRAVATLHQHERLLRAMRALPADTKLLLELYYWEDFTAPALGEVYGIPAATVRTRIYTARQRLQQMVGDPNELPADETIGASGDAENDDRDDSAIAIELRAIGQLLSSGPRAV